MLRPGKEALKQVGEILSIIKELAKTTEDLTSQVQEFSRRLDFIEERISLSQSAIAMLQWQQQRIAAVPDRKKTVPGGYGLIEPRSTWRRERPYKR